MRIKGSFALRAGSFAAGASVAVTLLVALAVLAWTSRPKEAGCPFAFGRPTSAGEGGGAQVVSSITQPPRLGTEQANLGPATHARALGLVLGETSREQVFDWGAMHGTDCHVDAQGRSVVCKSERPNDVAEAYRHASALTIFFDLNADARVDRVRLVAQYGAVEGVTRALAQASHASALQAGAPVEVHGEPTAAYLAAGALRQVRLHYARDNLVAQLSATNLGNAYHLVHTMQVR